MAQQCLHCFIGAGACLPPGAPCLAGQLDIAVNAAWGLTGCGHPSVSCGVMTEAWHAGQTLDNVRDPLVVMTSWLLREAAPTWVRRADDAPFPLHILLKIVYRQGGNPTAASPK